MLLASTGSSLPSYGWVQNQQEAYLVTTCPVDVKSREVQCRILTNSLQLSVRGETIAAGALFGPVDTEESTWELGVASYWPTSTRFCHTKSLMCQM